MLLLSATCPRPIDRWENAIRKTIWRTIQRAKMVEYYPFFTQRSGENSSIWQESLTRNLSGL